MTGHIKVGGAWKSATSYYVKVSGAWKSVTDGYVKISGAWKRFFQSAVSPSIESKVIISRNNSMYPSTLTGTNYHWNDATSLTYIFQKSSDDSSWTDIGTAATIANPSSGSSNTKTHVLTIADMPAYTSYYRFKVTATNSTYSTETTSTSTSVSVLQPAPINNTAPEVSPISGKAGTTEYSTTNGQWNPDDKDGVYAYQWQYRDSSSVWLNISGATSSKYTPPSNFFSSYFSPIRCRVSATNDSGTTHAYTGNATVNPPSATAPTSVSGTATDPAKITISWSGATNATKYRIYWNTTGSNPPGPASTTYDFNDTASPYEWTAAGANSDYYFFVAASGDDDVWSSWYGPSAKVTTPAMPNISTIVSRNGGTSGTYNMQWTITSTNASSYAITVYYGSTTPPTTAFSNTVTSSTIQSNLGNDNNDYYYLVITPYYGAGATGSAGTTRTTSIKRNTATPTNLTNTY